MKTRDELLIIFVRNPIASKVKTRLARTLGEQRALEVYQQLLQHTYQATHLLPFDKVVYYSDAIQHDDIWNHQAYGKKLQCKGDLGKRMLDAFRNAFQMGYRRVVIVGSDTFQITPQHILEAFDALKRHNFVLGPSHDGGYYLIGMVQLYATLFKNKRWSSASVLHDTLQDIRAINDSCHLLEELIDIDTEEDLMLSSGMPHA